MARIQQSIEVNVPARAAYGKLVQFDEYPRFMEGVETVRQTDASHLHWSARLAGRSMEWDCEITERLEDRRIAWRNVSGPQNAGTVDLEETGRGKASVTLTMECDPQQVLGAQDGNAERALSQRMWEDLARFKKLVETRDHESGDWRPSTPQAQAVRSTQSEASLSRASAGPDGQDGQGRFGIAEEQNFDQQSDQARRVGQMPQDTAGSAPAQGMAQAMLEADAGKRQELAKAIERALPPDEETGDNAG
ncbi:MAG TPA: SRPBCC family protein [Noviherbaspirillum sp.]|nr:SRPBCC family protein [Noviherbaspirillum sp.]